MLFLVYYYPGRAAEERFCSHDRDPKADAGDVNFLYFFQSLLSERILGKQVELAVGLFA